MPGLTITTPRTLIRLIEKEDLRAIHELHSLPETDQYNTLGIPDSIEETEAIVASWLREHDALGVSKYTFAILHANSSAFIGLFGLQIWPKKHSRAEVWYKLSPSYWNSGYATEVLSEVIAYGFQSLGLHRIQAGCAVDNVASIRVLEKAGMTREGRGRQVLPLKSGWSDNYEYAILETDKRKK